MLRIEAYGRLHLQRTLSCLFYQTNNFASSADSSLYRILDVSPKATQKEIKEAFYRSSKIFHPDVNPTPEAKIKFQKISEAYQVLGNPLSRRSYDRGITITSRSLPTADESESPFHSRGAEGFRDGTWADRRSRPATGQVEFEKFYRSQYTENLGRKFRQKMDRKQGIESAAAGGGFQKDPLELPINVAIVSIFGAALVAYYVRYVQDYGNC